ncbi:MAG: hypothetical protein ACFFAT_16225 [Promethearchaeota archaeon]
MSENNEKEKISISLRNATDILLLLYIQKRSYNLSIGLNTNEITEYLNKNNSDKKLKTKSVLDILRLLEADGLIKRKESKGSRFKQNFITNLGIGELNRVFFNKQNDCISYLDKLECNRGKSNFKARIMEISIPSKMIKTVPQQE